MMAQNYLWFSKRRIQASTNIRFSSLTLQTYQIYIQHAFKVFEWLSMTFLASFLKTETLLLENYCPSEGKHLERNIYV